MGEEKALVCFLDKKCFYTTVHQRRLNYLPQRPHKQEGIDRVKLPRALSCRFPVRVIFMGVVATPLPEIGFDGRIFLKRISERKAWKKTSYNQSLPENENLNSSLMKKIGGWR